MSEADRDKALEALGTTVHRVVREFNLAPGTYWRALRDVATDAGTVVIPAGRVHMLKRVRYVDDVPHSIELRHHPSESRFASTRSFLLREFLDCFEPEKNPEAVRAEEVRAIEAEIAGVQDEIERLNSDPEHVQAALVQLREDPKGAELLEGYDPHAPAAQALPEPGASVDTLPAGLKSESLDRARTLANNRRVLMKARAHLLRTKTKELQTLAERIAPFHMERADAIAAQASEAVDQAERIYAGLHTLELYTGEQVEVETLVEGEGAPADSPLVIRQRVLFMDEESLINAALGGADFSDFPRFAQMLADDPGLRDRIMPEPRCLVGMKFRRRPRDYGDAAANLVYNETNAESWLLIRDGENVHAVSSPLTYLTRLFPTQDDLDRPFEGVDGSQITVEDIRYPDSRDRIDNLALLYRRLLILVWGLYDRTDVLGRFALEDTRGHLNILSVDVQREIFRFVADDDEAATLASNRLPVAEWFERQNARLAPGRLVAGRWSQLISPESAPRCFSDQTPPGQPMAQVLWPREDVTAAVVKQDKVGLVVSVPVEGYSVTTGDPRETTTTISLAHASARGDYLVLDGLDSQVVREYLDSRETRRFYEQYAPILAAAFPLVQAIETAHEPVVNACVAQASGPGATPPEGLSAALTRAVGLYRSATRWKTLPQPGQRGYDTMLRDVMATATLLRTDAARLIKAVIDAGAERDGEAALLRVTITGRGRLRAYWTPLYEERENRAAPHRWVARIDYSVRETRQGIRLKAGQVQMVALPNDEASEAVIDERGEAREWVSCGAQGLPLTYDKARAAVDRCERGAAVLTGLLRDKGGHDLAAGVIEDAIYYLRHQGRGRYVKSPFIRIPMGVVRHQDRERYAYLTWMENAVSFAYWLADEAGQARIEAAVRRTYLYSDTHVEALHKLSHVGGLCLSPLRASFGNRYVVPGQDVFEFLPSMRELERMCAHWRVTYFPGTDELVRALAGQSEYPAETYPALSQWLYGTANG